MRCKMIRNCITAERRLPKLIIFLSEETMEPNGSCDWIYILQFTQYVNSHGRSDDVSTITFGYVVALLEYNINFKHVTIL